MNASPVYKYLKIKPTLFGLEADWGSNYLKTKRKARVSSLHCDICSTNFS